MNNLHDMFFIIGTGDFARELADMILDYKYGLPNYLQFVAKTKEELNAYNQKPYRNLLGITEESYIALTYNNTQVKTRTYIGLGDTRLREKIGSRLNDFAFPLDCSLNPHSSRENIIGKGSIIGPGSILTNRITVGDHVLINLACTIGHDVEIGSYSNLSPGCHINGHTKIGKACNIGSGTVTVPGAEIGDYCTIGAGAVVKGKLEAGGTYVGIPAKRIK